MTRWELSVDLGATFTRAATSQDGSVRPLEFDGATYMPSGVTRDASGTLQTGQTAWGEPGHDVLVPRLAVAAGPRTRIGGATLEASELAAAVLARVAEVARTRHRDGPPDRLVIAHPARWDAEVLGRLANAASQAALPDPVWVSEPVAAACHYGAASFPAGTLVGVYDLGGRTSAATILLRTVDGFSLAGPPGTDLALGAGDFDDALSDLVTADGDKPPAPRELTRTRHELSRQSAGWLTVDASGSRIRVTQPEFQDAIAGLVEQITGLFMATVRQAGVSVADLAAIYLAGGGGRTPLVAGRLDQAIGEGPELTVWEEPELAVVLGALAAAGPAGPGGRRPVNRERERSSPFEDD
jgi:molecular chaperone DnaK (HSP70)